MADDAAKAAGDDVIVHPLSKPITPKGFTEPLRELRFRAPNGKDITLCGDPVAVDFSVSPPKISINAKEMAAMMSRLSGQPPYAIDEMGSNDWKVAAWGLARFFVPWEMGTP